MQLCIKKSLYLYIRRCEWELDLREIVHEVILNNSATAFLFRGLKIGKYEWF